MRVVVIGAGLAGLATACHLVGRGYEVTAVEREPIPGGRNGQLVRDGFTFDTGPVVLTMRDLVDDTLRAADPSNLIDELLPMRRLDPAYRARYVDGSTIHVRHGHEPMRAEIAATCGPADARAFDGFVDWLADLYATEMPNFIARNFDSPADLLAKPLVAAHLLRLGGFGKLGAALRKRFTDERLHRLFGFQAMYAGLAPDDALAIYAVITYMDSIQGVWFPEGGMHALPVALAAAAERAGADFAYGSSVAEILRRPDTGGIAGVRLDDGTALAADGVVCTLDLPTAYERLLPDLPLPRVLRDRPDYSPSAVVWHVGVRGLPDPEVAHHNIHFGHAWAEAFDDLLKRGHLMRDPSRLVTIPSLSDPSMAPDGCSSLYVLEPVPNLDDGRIDWADERGPMRDRLLTFLADEGYPTDIVTEELVTPVEWHRQGMAAGTPFALAHTFAQTGPFRPPNVERRVPGLVFAGSGTVPGVGVPMVLISGKLAADRIGQYLRPGAERQQTARIGRGR